MCKCRRTLKLRVPLLFSVVALLGVTGNLLVIYVVLSTTDIRPNTSFAPNRRLVVQNIEVLKFKGITYPTTPLNQVRKFLGT